MAEVFGTIGNEQVELNNAATEATLRQLLQATLSASKQSADSVKNVVKNAGLDPAAVEATNKGMNLVGRSAATVGASWAGLTSASNSLLSGFNQIAAVTSKLTEGNAQASDIMGQFARLGGPIGALASGAQMLAQFQEKQLASYRSLTQAGVNFGGSLTDLRMAAANTYMTMDQFTRLMKDNSETFAKMGGTANDGAVAFTKLASDLQRGRFGDQLRALGYTSEQANQGLASYIAMTGGRNKKELENTQAITQAATEYMTQLDALAQITGKSREQQEQALKEESANQAYQSYLLTLDEEGKKKANAAMAEAMAKGGKGAAQALQSQLMGLPPMTKAAQEFTAVAPKMAAANNQMAAAVKDSSKGLDDVKKASSALTVAAIETKKDLGTTGQALIMQGGALASTVGQVHGTANQAAQQGIRTQADAEAQRKKIEAEQEARSKSQAAAAAETEKKMQELGQAILGQLMPAIASLLSVFNPMIQTFIDFAKYLANTPSALSAMLIAVGALTAAFVAYKVKMAVQAAKAVTRGTAANPMIVKDIGGKSGKAGKFGKLRKLAGGVGGVLGGLALGAASEYATEKGYEKTGAGLDIGSSALTGAGMGAMLGPVGAAVGGALGGAYGLYQNWGKLFGGGGKSVATPAAAAAASSSSEPAVSPVADPIENLTMQLQRLNTQTAEMVRYLKETAEQTRRNVDATRQLSGNLFPVP